MYNTQLKVHANIGMHRCGPVLSHGLVVLKPINRVYEGCHWQCQATPRDTIRGVQWSWCLHQRCEVFIKSLHCACPFLQLPDSPALCLWSWGEYLGFSEAILAQELLVCLA
jgi:hypothetical protein